MMKSFMDFVTSPIRRSNLPGSGRQMSRSAPSSPTSAAPSSYVSTNSLPAVATICSTNTNSSARVDDNKDTKTQFSTLEEMIHSNDNSTATNINSNNDNNNNNNNINNNNNNNGNNNILSSEATRNVHENSGTTTDTETSVSATIGVSNSTTVEGESAKIPSPEYSKISQSSLSPVKKEDDLISSILSTSFDSCTGTASLIGNEQYDDRLNSTENRKSILVYLLQSSRATEVKLNKVMDENSWLRDKCNEIEMKYEEVCLQLDEKNGLLHNINVRTDSLKDQEVRNNQLMEELKQENNQITFEMKRLQSEIQSSSDKASYLPTDTNSNLEQLNKYIKDVELRVSENQIHIEQIKDSNNTQFDVIKEVCGEHRESIDWLQDELIRVDKDVTVTNQYNRRQNLIIDGIPNNVRDHQLEHYCIEVIRKLGFQSRTNPLTPYDVVGCHRLKKRPGQSCAPTIIRFTNRKVAEFAMKHRNRLNSINMRHLSFREDLCPANEAIFGECEKLLGENLVSKVYTHNGFVKIVPKGTGRRIFPVKINHITDLDNMFPVDH